MLQDGESLLEFLERIGKNEEHRKIVKGAVIQALVSDICYFLKIALFSSLQQRLVVAFALLRKPFVYNLLIVLRLYFTEDFLERFNTEDGFDTTEISNEDILELLSVSVRIIVTKQINPNQIFDLIYNRQIEDSLINMSNKALHPSTTRGKFNRTSVQNINFVFSTPEDSNSQWEYIYNRLPFLLLFLNEILEAIFCDHVSAETSVLAGRVNERAVFFEKYNAD